jgi:hypothetical protein
MPLGILSDEEFNKELERSQVIDINKGRGSNPQVPESLRKIIGENAVEEGSGPTKAMTRALGISDSSLSAYKQGARSTASYHNPNPELLDHVNKARQRIVKKARNRLVFALDGITEEKLSQEKPRDLAAIAKDMSAIIKDFEPRNDDNVAPKALIIFAPQMFKEERFDVINAQEV